MSPLKSLFSIALQVSNNPTSRLKALLHLTNIFNWIPAVLGTLGNAPRLYTGGLSVWLAIKSNVHVIKNKWLLNYVAQGQKTVKEKRNHLLEGKGTGHYCWAVHLAKQTIAVTKAESTWIEQGDEGDGGQRWDKNGLKRDFKWETMDDKLGKSKGKTYLINYKFAGSSLLLYNHFFFFYFL